VDRRAGLGALAVLALLWASGLGPVGASSQALALSPPSLDLTDPPLVPGGTRIAHMTVFNSGDHEVDVITQGAEPAGSWIVAEPATFHLALHGQQDVTLRKGIYLGRIDFTPVAAAGNELMSGVSGLLNFSVDPTVVHNLAIDPLRAANVHRGDPLPVEAGVRNKGNVPDAYHLDVDILDAARTHLLLRTSFDGQSLLAGDNRTDTFHVPLVLAEGQYAVNLTATLKGTATVLRRELGLFQVAAPGADFKLGTLAFLSLAPKKVHAGQEVTLTVLFRNEGVVPIDQARFVGSVLRDGTAVGSVETLGARLARADNATLLATYAPDKAGTYLIRGHVVYDGLRTEEGEVAFEATGRTGFLSFLPSVTWLHFPAWLGTPLGLLLLLIGLLGLLAVWRRARRRDQPKPKREAPAPRPDPRPAPIPRSMLPAWLRLRSRAKAAAQRASGSPSPPRARAAGPKGAKRGKAWLAGAASLLRRATGVFHRKGASGRRRSSNSR
jgi:hypothetical protein